MRPFLLLCTLLVAVYGRPELPTGYNYPQPAAQQQTRVISDSAHIGYSGGATQNFGSNSFSLGGSRQTFSQNVPYQGSANFNQGLTGYNQNAQQVQYNTQGQIHKHVYVHVAPEEQEDIHRQQQIAAAPAQKHYKIIFIKAPSYDYRSAQQIAAAQQSQEKTIVYVLVKKPEYHEDIAVQNAAPVAPSKPEVYFIRYKSKTEQSSVGTGVGVGHDTESVSVNTGSVRTSYPSKVQTQYGPPAQQQIRSGPY